MELTKSSACSSSLDLPPPRLPRARRVHGAQARPEQRGQDTSQCRWVGQGPTGLVRPDLACAAHRSTPVTLFGTATDSQQDAGPSAQSAPSQLHHLSAPVSAAPWHVAHGAQQQQPQQHVNTEGWHLPPQPSPGHHVSNQGAWLNGSIKRSKSLQRLWTVLHTHAPRLNAIHASAALTHAMQLLRQEAGNSAAGASASLPQPLASLLVALQLQHVQSFGARQVANSMWALAKLSQHLTTDSQAPTGHSQSAQPSEFSDIRSSVLAADVAYLQEALLARYEETVNDMSPQELSMSWYAVGCMKPAVSHALFNRVLLTAQPMWSSFGSQELANLLWATAQLPHLCEHPAWAAWVAGIMQTQARKADDSTPGELSYSLWAGARLRQAAGQHQASTVDSTLHPTHHLNAHSPAAPASEDAQGPYSDSRQDTVGAEMVRGMGQGAPARGRTRRRGGGVGGDGDSQQGLDAPSAPHTWVQLPSSPQQDEAIPACAWLAWSLGLCGSLQHRTGGLQGAEMVQVLDALSHLPPCHMHKQLATDLLRQAATLAQRGGLSRREAASLLHAAARLGMKKSRRSRAWVNTMLRALLHTSQDTSDTHTLTTQDVTMSLYALAQLGSAPPHETIEALLDETRALLDARECEPGQVAMLLWACASLHVSLPPALMASFQKASHAVREELAPREMAALFWALGLMGLRPAPRWMHDLLECVWRRRDKYSTQELLHVVRGVGRVRHESADVLYDRLLSELQQRHEDAPDMAPALMVDALCALARAKPPSAQGLQWAQDGLLNTLVARHLPTLHATELVRMMWAAATLAFPTLPPRVPAQQPQPYLAAAAAAATATAATGSDSSTSTSSSDERATSPDGSSGSEDSDSGLEVGLRPVSWMAKAGRDVQAAGSAPADAVGGAVPAAAPNPLQEHADNDAQDVLDALAAGLPAQQLLDNTRKGKEALLLQWQALRRRPGRLMLPEPHVCSLLRACIQARTHLNAQQLAVVLSALPRLNIRPSRTWMTTMLFSHPHLLRSFTHHELALTVFSLGCMRMQPPEDWMQLCTQQVLDRAPYMNAGMVSGVLRGLCMLSYSPGPLWMSQFMTCAVPALRCMPHPQLAIAYQSAVDVELGLAEEWGHLFSTLLHSSVIDLTEDASVTGGPRNEDAGEA